MFDFEFAGKKASSLGVFAIKRPTVPPPVLRFNSYTVPGRDGILTDTDGTYEPIPIAIECNFMSSNDNTYYEKQREVKSWMLSRENMTLSLSDNPDFYYKVQNLTISSFERISKRICKFTAEFICQPYEFKKNDVAIEIPIDEEQTIVNEYIKSYPLYLFSGNGSATLNVNGADFYVNVSDNLHVDTELQLAYRVDGKILNQNTYGDFESLIFKSGENKVLLTTFVDSTAKLSIYPRWRSL